MGVNRRAPTPARSCYPSGPRLDGTSDKHDADAGVSRLNLDARAKLDAMSERIRCAESLAREEREKPQPGDPDPCVFEIRAAQKEGDWLIVRLHYPSCVNYEGNKIAVYRGVSLTDLVRSDMIDPHFLETPGRPSPVARFVPTDEGWSLAVAFCRAQATGGAS